jgi:hypothetical protein
MSRLRYTAVTSAGAAYEIQFPLHVKTRSEPAVAEMLGAVLEGISGMVETRGDVSDGDVLQSLAMAMAIRARMVDAAPAASLRLMHELLDGAFAAALSASSYPSGRA